MKSFDQIKIDFEIEIINVTVVRHSGNIKI